MAKVEREVEVSKLNRQIDEEGVHYVNCSLSVLDRLAEIMRLDPESLNPEEAICVLDDLLEENDRFRRDLDCLDVAMAEILDETSLLKLMHKVVELKENYKDGQ